jgi:hypothetical protein
MAPDLERLARTPWPMVCWASSGMRLLSSPLARSCARKAGWVRAKTSANFAQALEALISTIRTDACVRWLNPKQAGHLAALHAAPELALGRHDEVLLERIGVDLDLHPPTCRRR